MFLLSIQAWSKLAFKYLIFEGWDAILRRAQTSIYKWRLLLATVAMAAIYQGFVAFRQPLEMLYNICV
jgi:hypothetical protein